MNNTKNVLLVKSELGKSMGNTRDLPSDNHSYGKQLPRTDVGVKKSKVNKALNSKFTIYVMEKESSLLIYQMKNLYMEGKVNTPNLSNIFSVIYFIYILV